MASPEPIRLSAEPGFELWLFELQTQPALGWLAWLSEGERSKAARFVFERDRRRYLAAHTMLRHLLSRHTSIPPAQLEFNEGRFGKPALRHVADCSFNLSHSEDIAVLLIAARGEIGVDVEMHRLMPDAQLLAERNFSRAECASLRSIDSPQRDAAFLTGWTRKEACLKAVGSGLSIAPDTFTAGLTHEPCTTSIDTPDGCLEVAVQSFCHEQRLLVATAVVESHRTA